MEFYSSDGPGSPLVPLDDELVVNVPHYDRNNTKLIDYVLRANAQYFSGAHSVTYSLNILCHVSYMYLHNRKQLFSIK